MFGTAEAIQAGTGEHQRVGLARCPLAQARIDIATHRYELQIGPKGKQHGLPPRAGRRHARAHGQHVQAPVAFTHKRIAGIGARRDRREREARIQRGGQILQRVHRYVDTSVQQSILDLLDEDALGVQRRAVVERRRRDEGGILHAVARGANDLDGNGVAVPAKLLRYMVCLPQGQLGTAGTKAYRFSTHR